MAVDFKDSQLNEVHFHELLEYKVITTTTAKLLQSCLTFWDPMNRSTPGLPVHHQLPEFTQTHVHQVSDAIQSSQLLSSPFPSFNLSQHQGLFK